MEITKTSMKMIGIGVGSSAQDIPNSAESAFDLHI
jgi:hypothetical protein